jgi:hypothetical protein
MAGRFMSEDPIRSGLNYYTYCGNNPVNFIDPWGLAEVGLRAYAESFGAIVGWNSDTGYASVTYNGQTLYVKSTAQNNRDGRIYINDSVLNKQFGWGAQSTAKSDVFASNALSPFGTPNTTDTDGATTRTYGSDGRAKTDVHDTDHGNPKYHLKPHGHDWDWADPEHPKPGPPYPVPAPTPVPTPAPAPTPAPVRPSELSNNYYSALDPIGKAAGWAVGGTVLYWIISEASRVFPPRNLIPVP